MRCKRAASFATYFFLMYARNRSVVSALLEGFREPCSLTLSPRVLPFSSSVQSTFKLRPGAYESCRTRSITSASSFGTRAPGWNRYERLRSRLSAVSSDGDARTQAGDIAKETVSVLTRKGRTWQRLGPMVELACCSSTTENIKTIADVGTDHGILAIALAATAQYEKVVGVDISEDALRQGARMFHSKILGVLSRGSAVAEGGDLDSFLPIEFRVGNGLSPLEPGDADAVAICGMGVHTMQKILLFPELDRIGTNRLYLQPTNSRPRNLITLYDFLQRNGWTLKEECIQYISNRWYITSAFQRDPLRHCDDPFTLPGRALEALPDTDSLRREHQRYVKHHLSWLERDLQAKGSLDEADVRWRKEYIIS